MPPWNVRRSSAPSTPTSASNGSASGRLSLRDGQLDSSSDGEDVGLAVRVVHDGTWGFASGIARTAEAAKALAEQAVATAKVSRVLSSEPVVLAPEQVYADVSWVSSYEINPFDVPEAERVAGCRSCPNG